MRLWSLHPKYLDIKGLLGVWREALLAKEVLKGNTIGYKGHAQLTRFKECVNPLLAINTYLYYIYMEGKRRGYKFDKTKVGKIFKKTLTVNKGQLKYEFEHLQNKLKIKFPGKSTQMKKIKIIEPHPLFTVVNGRVEGWERIYSKNQFYAHYQDDNYK